MPLQLHDSGDVVLKWRQVMNAMFGGTAAHPGLYARLLGPLPLNTNVFGVRAQAWQQEYERRTGQTVDGIVSDTDLLTLKVVVPHRPIWAYSAPGSGAPWNVGPPFDAGEWAKLVLNVNHQPVGYPIGGYMGLMGGNPDDSYLDIYGYYETEQLRLLSINPDFQASLAKRQADPNAVLVNGVDVELWFLGYSQSADFMVRFVNKHFGDGGQFACLRDRVNGLVLCGNPARQPGQTKIGNTPVGWGISRLVYPAWLNALTWSVTVETPSPDFYAACADEIRPLFYEWFIKAETSLPFVVYCGQIIIPAILNLLTGGLALLGSAGLSSALAVPVLASASGVAPNLISGLLGGILGSTEKPDPKLIEFLSVKGVLTNLPGLLTLLGDLGGVAAHGDYYTPRAELGGRNGVQVACDVLAGFRR